LQVAVSGLQAGKGWVPHELGQKRETVEVWEDVGPWPSPPQPQYFGRWRVGGGRMLTGKPLPGSQGQAPKAAHLIRAVPVA
jgi:hypothetical protein